MMRRTRGVNEGLNASRMYAYVYRKTNGRFPYYAHLIASSFVRIIVRAITVISLPTSAATTTSTTTTHVTHVHPHVHQIHYLSAIIVITPSITAVHIVVRIHKGFRILYDYAENCKSYGEVECLVTRDLQIFGCSISTFSYGSGRPSMFVSSTQVIVNFRQIT